MTSVVFFLKIIVVRWIILFVEDDNVGKQGSKSDILLVGGKG